MPRTALTLILIAVFALAGAEAADLDWTQTSRVFLIDAYAYPLAPELEYDAEALARTMQDMHANVVRFATMGKYCTIQGARFTTHPDQGSRDLLAETIAACKPRGIKVVPYISTGHKLAWSMVTRDYPQYAHISKPGGGPLKLRMFAGEEHGTVCWNTPYRRAYLDLVEHVVRDYEIHGIYFDRWSRAYFWQGMKLCYCDGCRSGFRTATGLEIPYREKDEDYSQEERTTIRRYHEWYQDQLVSVLREVRRIVKKYKDIPLIYNINNPQSISGEDPRVLENHDAFLYERGESMLKRAEGVSLARAAGFHVWPYIGGYDNWPRVVHNGLDYQQEIFTTAMFGGGLIVAQPTGFIRDKENADIVARPFELLEKNEALFRGFSNYPHVAVVYAFEDPPDHAQKNWFWQSDVRTATAGAFAACLYRHIQVTSLLDRVLDDPTKLSQYKLLFLADIPHLSEQRVRNVRDFVKNGGGLIATYTTSLYNGEGQKQARFALEELLRVKPIQPAGELARDVEYYSSKLGGPHDLYVLGRKGRLWKERLVPAWFYQPVEVLEGGVTEADIVRGDGAALLPAVVTSNYGKGRVAFLASSLESLYGQSNARIVGEFLETLIRKVAAEPSPYEVRGPETLIANLTVKAEEHVLHLTNWTGSKFEMPRVDEYYIAPVENVQVRLHVPKAKKLDRLRLLVPGSFRARNLPDGVEISLPRVEAYQGIAFRLK
ncbi:MAG: hypothetical protein EHM61_00500 [Acidobacteria bacterium]|nr:MAG: hypothetical protein EHM61_00500 [Acidobacteriota bacterium]